MNNLISDRLIELLPIPLPGIIDVIVASIKLAPNVYYNGELSFMAFHVNEEVKLGVDFLNFESRYVFIWWVILLSVFTYFY